MSAIERITKKVYSMVNTKREIDYNDPDFAMIKSLLSDLPESRLEEFYIFLMTDKETYNAAGFVKRQALIEAKIKFKKRLEEEIWRDYSLEEKIGVLVEKIGGVYDFLIGKTEQEKAAFCDTVDFGKLKRRSESGELEPMFGKEEVEIVEDAGLKRLLDILYQSGSAGVRDALESAYKSKIIKERMGAQRAQVTTARNGGVDDINKRVVQMLPPIKRV